jgi:uncharacterized protein YyaL (SSP411 family)
MPTVLAFLAGEAERAKSKLAAKMVTLTLDRMARGGIYDQLGGGFHRYSTERTWTVPHFEKMLYDNAQLVEVNARDYLRSKNPQSRRIVQETLAFVAREMTSPEGGFYSALDAETGDEEGRFYVWTDKELADALKDKKDVRFIKKVYGANEGYNFEGRYHILVLPKPLAETARAMKLSEGQLEARFAPLRKKLFEARSRRAKPFLDKKILTAWNGQMIAGYALAGQVCKEPKYMQAAVRAADFVLKKLRTKEGRLHRTYGARPGKAPEAHLNGYLDDYAFLVHGLLNLHDATGDKKWFAEAKFLTETMIRFHSDKDRGGFFYTSNDHEKLFARAKDQFDGVQPSANSMAVRNLVRLWDKTGDNRYHDLARKHMKAFAATLKQNSAGMTTMMESLAMLLESKTKPKKKE